MEAARPRRRRRRPRRGTVDTPLNERLVRVSTVVVVPAVLALLFSMSTTGTLPRPALDPLFDPAAASTLTEQLSTAYPARVPGTVGAADAARWYEQAISTFGLRVETQLWTETLPALGEVALRNVVAVAPGRSEDSIVVVAHRDNGGADRPHGDNASGTAALIELARGFGPQQTAPAPLPERTLVFVSTDGGAYGGAGAAHFARESPYADRALAAIVLDGIGGGGRPGLVVAGDRPASPARALVSTAASRVREQVGVAPRMPSVLAQLVGLAIPLAVGEQGPFLAKGVAAVTLTTHEPGEPRVAVGDPPIRAPSDRLGQLGRATEALIGSVDASVGGTFRTPDSVFFAERVASGWALRLSLIAAVAPFAIGVVDLLARARRRRLPFLPAVRALRARALFWIYAALLLWIAALSGALPTGASLPLPPYSEIVLEQPTAGVGLLAIALAAGWLVARRRLVPTRTLVHDERLAGTAVGLAWLGAVAIVACVAKPYALTFLLPSLYAWLWLPAAQRGAGRIVLYLLGLAGPAVALLVLGRELALGVVDTFLYLATLTSVGYVSAWSVLLGVAWVAAAAQLGAIAFGRYAPYAAGAASPPPGAVRTAVGAVARRARGQGRYVNET